MPAHKSSAALAAELTTQQVASRIHTLRGVQVLFDRDLALFFDVKPIRLREQVKRNANRFPEDFMFQLTGDEVREMVSQNAIPSKQQLGGALPFAFTEEGVAALSAVLRSERAVQVGIQIVRAFVAMRKFILNHARIFQRLDHVERWQILADQNDTENVPLRENIETYFAREVTPHVPDAWIDPTTCDAKDGKAGKLGYEIPFNRHFYVFQPPRPLSAIDADLKASTDRILTMIGGLTA